MVYLTVFGRTTVKLWPVPLLCLFTVSDLFSFVIAITEYEMVMIGMFDGLDFG